jgi:imidazolonepropionase-like amidohydrolase
MSAKAASGEALHLQGTPLPSGKPTDLYVVDGKFTFAKPAKATTVHKGGWILPGLVDAHAHLALASPAGDGSPQEAVRASATAQLQAGVLLLREPGSIDYESKAVGPHLGLPRVLTGGRFLAPPDGYFPGLAREVTTKELPKAAAEEAKASGAWVKVIGDFPQSDGVMHPHWDLDTLKATAAAAHKAGARITMHAVHPDSISTAIQAGFDCIEHGTGLRKEHVDAMVAKNMAFTPTLMIAERIPGAMGGLCSDHGMKEIEGWLSSHPKRVAAAAAAGVRILAGSDAAMWPHGLVARETAALVEAGVPAERAVAATSWDARAYLGFPGIAEGAPADLVVFDQDPRRDVHALEEPSFIVLDGKVVPPGPSGY